MKVGILTGGGDCPGLNAVIRGVVRTVHNGGGETIGLLRGWKGALDGEHIPLTPENTDAILNKGGTILGSSRTNPYKKAEQDVPQLLATFKKLGLDALVAIGGDDTLGVANRLYNEHKFPIIGCPKTIDNDLSCTDVTFGFDTSINIVVDAIERLRTTTESHRRIMVVETMGRHAGWIACESGMAAGADYILVPEEPVDIEKMCATLKARYAVKQYGIVVASEGAVVSQTEGLVTQNARVDDFGHVSLGGVGQLLADLIEKKTGIETRFVVLGHIQRGGSPSAYDRVLGTRLGIAAGRLIIEKKFGRMVALSGTRVIDVALADAVGQLKTLDPEFLRDASEFFQ